MNTRFRKIQDADVTNKEIYEEAGKILKDGGLVAFPTETVYGLGADAMNPQASAKIYAAKGRPSDNPLIIHIADVDALNDLCEEVPKKALLLAKKFWPGPLTMVLRKKENVPKTTTGGLDTVAIRMPNHPVALELIRTSGVYVAAPSANLSGRPSPTRAEHVLQDMDGRIEMILDGGSVEIGIESTIVDLTEEEPVILRPGYITREMLSEVVGPVSIDPAVALGVKKDVKPKAPGMKYRHYAPRGELVIVESCEAQKAVAAINALVQKSKEEGKITGVLTTDENREFYQADHILSVGSRDSEISISSHLFDVLRKFDDLGTEAIYSEGFSRENVGYAIMNRLMKAAGGKIINVDESEELTK
ncbi:MAG: L-threonylcarbamoyladenylate synthase [Lachnospiraceae bacterium]